MYKKILIISFYFPPYPKVGARRWAKFAKYLKRNGHEVKVLCATYDVDKQSPWDKDVKDFESDIIRIKLKYRPAYCRKIMHPRTFFEKLRWHISYRWRGFIKIFKEDEILDVPSGFENIFFKSAKQLLEKHHFNNVIVTGGPFHVCYFAAKLKKYFNNFNFIVDLRDFWVDGDDYKTLSEKRKTEERAMEKFTFYHADHIITSAERIEMRIKDVYPEYAHKVLHISHAYDQDDFSSVSKNISIKINSSFDTIKIIYAGSLYINMDESILLLIDFLKKILLKGRRVILDLYTFDNNYYNLFKEAGLLNIISYFKPIKPSNLFQKMIEYDVVSVLKSVDVASEHSKSAKFYELIATRKPIVYFGKAGDISKFIEQNKLGFCIQESNGVDTKVLEVLNNMVEQNVPDVNFDIKNFSFELVTRQVEKILI